MVFLVVLWVVLGALAFGPVLFSVASMRAQARKPWKTKIGRHFKPKISIMVPTYNESSIIRWKLQNLIKLKYPSDLMQIVVVDSNSDDQTADMVQDFVRKHHEFRFCVLTENERKGKSKALNHALKECDGDVIIVSDADCFWPSSVLDDALPYLADPTVGAISGPKILLNPKQSWVTRTEDTYLNSMNLMRLGESKTDSTLLFEGGFSAYKKEMLHGFDPYNTGSDDCGTIIKILENGSKAIFVPEAKFYTAFPVTLRGKISIKTRRANQLVRLFSKYASLVITNRLKSSKRVILQNILFFLFSPLMFIPFLITSILVVLSFPYVLIVLVVLLHPMARLYAFEAVQGLLSLFLAMLSIAFGKKMTVWDIPPDRSLVSEDMLRQHTLI
jgi:cellulose synthase/poly-beta-1,6-N-acetylglucosamine synthase-like glycosyltransferase